MMAEAEAQGITLLFSDGQQKQENQIAALRSFIAQGVDAIILAVLAVIVKRLMITAPLPEAATPPAEEI